MRILFSSFEVAPFAKVGGLADVAGALPVALSRLGHEVMICMPAFGMAVQRANAVEAARFDVQIRSDWVEAAIAYRADFRGVELWLIDAEKPFFADAQGSQDIYRPGLDQHIFFPHAVLALSEHLGRIPDLVHAHDWQQGLLPAILREKKGGAWQEVPSLFTIHNHAYQGEFGFEVLRHAGLPDHFFHPDAMEAWGAVNFLKAGMMFADHANTVSPNYAKQIQTPEYGNKLEGLMGYLDKQGRLSGILNGIDTEVFNPETDPALPAHFTATEMEGKKACKASVVDTAGFRGTDLPLMGMVTRISRQKGLDLVLGMIPSLPKIGARLVVQGLGDPDLVEAFHQAAQDYPEHVAYFERFDEELAQRIYAGCDLFLMPSAFEPCGLGQMIAMRYGTLPVVRATGGLADTVEEGVTGFRFDDYSVEALQGAVQRAVAQMPAHEMIWNAMNQDLSWDRSAKEYEALYASLVRRRAGVLA